MRLASFALCFGGTTALAATVQSINANVEKGTHGHTAGADITIFDGMRVPKLRELTSDNAESALNRTKYMVVNYGT